MTEVPAHAEDRLRADRTIWMATVAADGTPSVRPVWFTWDGAGILVYSQPGTAKIRHLERNPRTCLHLDPDEWGESVVVLTGEARIAPEQPAADQVAEYVEKYRWGFERLGVSAAEFAADYSVPILVSIDGVQTY
jgi:PPOX class probable F420-dependent enzyme